MSDHFLLEILVRPGATASFSQSERLTALRGAGPLQRTSRRVALTVLVIRTDVRYASSYPTRAVPQFRDS